MCTKTYRIKDIIEVFNKSEMQASEGKNEGVYPFYTSSSEQKKYCNKALYKGNAITMGTGGKASINYVKGDFSTSTDCFNYTANKYTKFLYYYLLFQLDKIDAIGFQGIGIKHLQKDFINNMKVRIPYNYENITNYLDKKITEIDNVIEKTKETIEDYKKYKQSFIIESVCRGNIKNAKLIESNDRWIGKIPDNYKIIKLNKIANIVRGGSPRPAGDLKYYEGNIPFMKISDITKDDEMFVNECKDSIKEAGLSRTRYVEKNTLLLTNSGATLGIPKINTFKTTFNDGIAAFMNLKTNMIDIEFAYYSLKARTKYFLEEASMGMGQPNLNTDIIGATKIVLPDISEQKIIVRNINRKCSEIGKLIENKHTIIEELDKYKKSLIFEYVTGKKELV